MSQETSPNDAALPARRRIVPLTERRVQLPVAIIAHEGEEREQLETLISSVRPVVSFPSLAHFGDAARKERWAGIVVARTHAWDASLDHSVPRRAFIALFRLADEGYGWPDAVKRIATPEELQAWLTDLAAPVLPPDDRQRVVKPRAKRSVFTMSLAGPDPKEARTQLTLPSLSVVATSKAKEAPAEEPATPVATHKESTQASAPAVRTLKLKKAAPSQPKSNAIAPKRTLPTAGVAPKGLRLTSDDAHEQAIIDAVSLLGAAQARAIVDAVEKFEQAL